MDTLTNIGTTYDATNAPKGLGFAEIDFTGVTAVVFTVFIRKVGTGIQSWQLWNDTNLVEIGVIDDAGVTGDKYLTATFASAVTGIKRIRVRAKSTVLTDDPLYYGSALRLVKA